MRNGCTACALTAAYYVALDMLFHLSTSCELQVMVHACVPAHFQIGPTDQLCTSLTSPSTLHFPRQKSLQKLGTAGINTNTSSTVEIQAGLVAEFKI